jgi:uncharacterized protein with HEPN domain
MQVIGEAASRISDDVQFAHPEVAWSQIIAMRNILVHDYFNVDTDEVWATVERDIPILKNQVEAILNCWSQSQSD